MGSSGSGGGGPAGRSQGRRSRYCRCHGHDLLTSLVDGAGPRAWRRFLARPGGLDAVLTHLAATSPDGNSLQTVRDLVAETVDRAGGRAFTALRSYLRRRAGLSAATRQLLDDAIRGGDLVGVGRAIALATEFVRTESESGLAGPPLWIRDHWYADALSGRATRTRVIRIPARIADVANRLQAHHRAAQAADTDTSVDVYELYGPVFTAPDVRAAAEFAIEAEGQGPRMEVEAVVTLLGTQSLREARRRLAELRAWMAQTGMNDLVVTKVLAEFLSQPGDFSSLLAELGRLVGETRGGRFRVEHAVQRDLEFAKFFHEYARLDGVYRRLPYPKESLAQLYRRFKRLPVLSHRGPGEAQIDDSDALEVSRLSHEAAGLLRFLRRFRAGTSTPVVVVGNNRYGRQWLVEPLEPFLGEDFTVRYDGVPSHQSMRLSVPHARNFEWSADNTGPWTPDAFPMEFARQMALEMPHIVVVDAMSPRYSGVAMFSRATKTYAHWFVTFNDVRNGGPANDFIPRAHLEELRHWYEYVRLHRQLSEWVGPGPGYRLGLWAPRLTDTVQLGELNIQGRPVLLDSDEPQAVLTNPMIYSDDSLPKRLHGTRPYYFDGPEGQAQEEIVFGFGPFGFQPEIRGTMTASFVAEVQRRITAEVAELISVDGDNSSQHEHGGNTR